MVTTYEQVFEIIHEGHIKWKHARDVRKNERCINDDLGYYGVPEQAVQCFIDTCPMVSNTLFYFITVISVVLLISSPFFCQCLSNIILTKAKQHPLKMILLQRVGSRFQMDLIEMPPCDTYRHILHVVHHFSLYGFVAPLADIGFWNWWAID